MTIELSYQKGDKLNNWQLLGAIRRQLPELFEYEESSVHGLNIPIQVPKVKEAFDIKVTITINHESINGL